MTNSLKRKIPHTLTCFVVDMWKFCNIFSITKIYVISLRCLFRTTPVCALVSAPLAMLNMYFVSSYREFDVQRQVSFTQYHIIDKRLLCYAVVTTTIRLRFDGLSTAYQMSLRSQWRNPLAAVTLTYLLIQVTVQQPGRDAGRRMVVVRPNCRRMEWEPNGDRIAAESKIESKL